MDHLNRYFILTVLLLFAGITHAQNDSDTVRKDTAWKFEGNLNINFSQVELKNWTGGGQSSISLAAFNSMLLTYEKNRHYWYNILDMGYGMIRQGSVNEFRKTDDELLFATKYNYRLQDRWYFATLLDFRTQFTTGYDYYEDSLGEEQSRKISEFMAPAYLISAVGIEYKVKDRFYLLVAPISGKTTFVLDEQLSNEGRYGVTPGEKIRQEFGANLQARIMTPVVKNVNFKSSLNLFSAYRNPDEIDVNWQAQLVMKINSYLAATVTTQLIYDEDVRIEREDGTTGPTVQFKEVIAVGLTLGF